MKIQYIINRAHSLMEEQMSLLSNMLDPEDCLIRVDIPEEGCSLDEQVELAHTLMDGMGVDDYLVFVSPLPCMLGYICSQIETSRNVLVFGNDKREKTELPNGKIISSVSKCGWYLFNPLSGEMV